MNTPITAESGRSAVVAIVDDEGRVRTALDSLIRSLGAAALGYASGRDMLADIDGLTEIDCLISDVQMPHLSGIELLAALRARGHDFPVILITAYPDDALRERAMAGGAAAFFAKPFDPEAFGHALSAALEKR